MTSRRTDLALALLLCAVGVADVLSTAYTESRVVALAAVALQTLPVALRRTHLLAMVLLAVVGVAVEIVVGGRGYGDIGGMLAYLVVVFSVARWAGGTARPVAAALLVLGLLAHEVSQAFVDPGMLVVSLVVVGGLTVGLWWLGSSLRAAEARERDQEARLAAAVEQERRAIARDLHDVVGHSLAGIALTASAAERQPGAQDPGLQEALGLISTASRDAASDLRRLVGLLREESDLGGIDPKPSLAALPALAERVRAAGQPVRLTSRGVTRPVPPGWELTVYRVVQEGLTNVTRHAPGSSAEVVLDWRGGELVVQVVDRGAPEAPGGSGWIPARKPGRTATGDEPPPGGHGLLGLAERVSLYGGTVEPSRDGSAFVLTARMPYP